MAARPHGSADSAPEASPDRPEGLRVGGRATALDYFFFARPVLMPPVWTIALLGIASTGGPPLAGWRWVALFVQLFCLFGAVYTLNQIKDIAGDRLNRKLHFLPLGLIPLAAAWRFTLALNLIAIALAVWFGIWYTGLSLGIIVLGVLYSMGTRPWKNRPITGFAANVLGHGTLVFLLGRVFVEPPGLLPWWRVAAYTLAVGAVYLATTVPDVAGDRQAGKATAAVRLGGRPTMALATMLIAGALFLAFKESDLPLIFAAAPAGPLFLLGAIYRDSAGWATMAAKAAVLFLSLAAAWAYPAYLVVLGIGFLGTRLFFRWRFGMDYPSLAPGK